MIIGSGGAQLNTIKIKETIKMIFFMMVFSLALYMILHFILNCSKNKLKHL